MDRERSPGLLHRHVDLLEAGNPKRYSGNTRRLIGDGGPYGVCVAYEGFQERIVSQCCFDAGAPVDDNAVEGHASPVWHVPDMGVSAIFCHPVLRGVDDRSVEQFHEFGPEVGRAHSPALQGIPKFLGQVPGFLYAVERGWPQDVFRFARHGLTV